MKKRHINKVAVLGSGVMGSRIACHMANCGLEVLLLDIVPKELKEQEKSKGFTLETKQVRNRIVNDSLKSSLKSKPSPIFTKRYASRIKAGNFEDNLSEISEYDWIIEVVVERLDIKQQVFGNVEKYRKEGTLISTNTSGIPIQMMLEGRSEDFKKHFLGTHFFNPPRYLNLLEIIPSKDTDTNVVDFFMEYGSKFLGKKTVLCKDTPAFIANRVGVFSIMSLFHIVEEMDLTVEEVDKLTGPVLGRPKSATFRTCDVVGLDTLVHVANGLKAHCPHDEMKEKFELPSYIDKMVANKMLGSKSGKGFYQKVKGADGKSQIQSLDLKTLGYREKQKVSFPTLQLTKTIDDLNERTKILYSAKGKEGEFYKKSFNSLFLYVSNRIPEIADELFKIDDAVKAGFGWKLGPFESWDTIGVKKVIERLESENQKPAQWVYDMLESGAETFYKIENGNKLFWDIPSGTYKVIPGTEEILSLDALRDTNTVWKNSDSTIVDLGDGILNVEFHTKMNTIGGGVLQGINKAIDLAEAEHKGLVISNTGDNFSAGANVGLIFMYAIEQEYEDLDMAVREFQRTAMRIRYSNIPVVVAPHNMALGGSCEFVLHADKVVAHAETYMGLVEMGVGVIPAGAGTKEFALRASDEFGDGPRINILRNKFLTIGQAKVSTSAEEAFELGYLRRGIDEWVISREHQLSYAKEVCLAMANKGYTQPIKRNDITVLGKEGLGIVYVGADSMKAGNYISEHDKYISEKLGNILCGGELSSPTKVSEDYLLELERKTFVELCKQRKSLERMESLVKTGKILRN